MIVTDLKLSQFRGLESAHFEFKPGVNVIAGVNGAGKSTVLDALRILLSRASGELMKLREKSVETSVSDIQRERGSYDIDVEFITGSTRTGTVYSYIGHLDRESYLPGTKPGDVREQGTIFEPKFEFFMPKPLSLTPGEVPLTLFFSPHRSLLTQEATKSSTEDAAFGQALGDRRFNLRQIAEWWLAQEALSDGHKRFADRIQALEQAIYNFLPNTIQLVRPIPGKDGEKPKLVATKNKQDFDLFELSDGERGLLAICLETARRLALAFPELPDPVSQGSACILIDEIELHLHPHWQREVLGWLIRTFPNCQFIVTTHSPTVVSEIEHERVWIIGQEGVWQPDRSLGLDVSRILEEIMGASARNADVEKIIEEISQLIDEERFDAARAKINELSSRLGESDAEVVRATSMLTFAEGSVDSDSEGN